MSEQSALLKIMESVKSADKRILLLGTPTHGNLGDQAIVAGELRILKDYFPDREVIEVPSNYLSGKLGELLRGSGFAKYVRRDDLIFMHGGGNLGNLWLNEEQLRRALIEKFPDNKIVIFPQSIHFTDDDAGRRELAISQRVYNTHDDLHLMTRDEISFAFAQKFFPQANNYLMPDAATILHGVLDDVDTEREGVLFILRGDKEKVRDDAKIQILQKYFTERKIPFEVTDTVIAEKVTANTRDEKIRAILMKIRQSKVVVTDRFHGVIFAFVTRTPVLAFKSFDTKISSGIRWFKNLPSIFYAESSDWQSAKNFVDKYYFAAEEKDSVALNVKIDTDSPERFSRTLNKIVGTYSVKSSTPLRIPDKVDNRADKSRRLTVDAVNISGQRIVFKYTVQGDWKRFFNERTEFFIEYSEDISDTPKDIAVIPFLCNVLPIAWVTDAEVVVEELDYDFYTHLAKIKRGYVDMYPRMKFGGKLTVGNLVRHDYKVGKKTAAFFSGGADSFDTLIAHAKEHPTLVTLRGSDVKLTDIKGWELVSNHALETARQFKCKNLFVTSAFRLFLNEGALSALVEPLANDNWWSGFQHGIGIIGHVAPYAYLHRLKTIYIASSFTAKFEYTCASDPTIDNHVRIGKCTTVHDGYEFSRQDKIRRICEFKRATGTPIRLHVCWQSAGGENCCACGKCYRTICAILAEGENPKEMGFSLYSPVLLEKLHQEFKRSKLSPQVLARRWFFIQERFRERPENLPEALNWLMDVKF